MPWCLETRPFWQTVRDLKKKTVIAFIKVQNSLTVIFSWNQVRSKFVNSVTRQHTVVFWYEIRKNLFLVFIVLLHSFGCNMYARGLRNQITYHEVVQKSNYVTQTGLTLLYILATSRHHSTHFCIKDKMFSWKRGSKWDYSMLAPIFGTWSKRVK